jgi:DNA-binding Xre family transcriptional regulator
MKKISYDPLWVTLIRKGIKNKTELLNFISSGTLAKLSKDQEVSMSVLIKLSTALDVPLSSIVETIEE